MRRRGGQGWRAEILQGDGQPEAVDALVGQTVEVGVGIIVHIVHQLVAVSRRALDGAEETAGNPRPDERTAFPPAERQKRSFRLAHHRLDGEDAAADSLGVGRQYPADARCDLDAVGLENRHRGPGGFDDG